jgi:hypothetical protein
MRTAFEIANRHGGVSRTRPRWLAMLNGPAYSPATVKFCGQCGSVLATRWHSNHSLMAYRS